MSSPTKIWSQVLLTKYSLDHTNHPPALHTRYSSYSTKSIGKVWNDTKQGLVIERRSNFGRIWWDCLVTKSQPLFHSATGSILDDIIITTVDDFVDDNGNWNWLIFSRLLPNTFFLELHLSIREG